MVSEWERGPFEATRLRSQSIDSINYVVKIISSSVPGPASASLALDAAAVDAELAPISDELIEKLASAGFERILKRFLHRREHLGTIRQALR